jgi:hypothetical protein
MKNICLYLQPKLIFSSFLKNRIILFQFSHPSFSYKLSSKSSSTSSNTVLSLSSPCTTDSCNYYIFTFQPGIYTIELWGSNGVQGESNSGGTGGLGGQGGYIIANFTVEE